MPPRKSTVSEPSEEPGAESTTPAKATKEKVERESVGVEDLSLPKSMIARLAKGVLPANTQIQKDALLALHKSATVFVSYIASNSNELARMGGKKTIAPQDVMSALKDAELEEFLPRLEAELKKYNDVQCDKRNSYRHRVKQEKAAAEPAAAAHGEGESAPQSAAATPSAQLNGSTNGHADDMDRPVKKLKGSDGVVVVTPGEQIDDEDLEDVAPEADDGEDGEEDDEEGEDEEPEDGEEGHVDETMEEVDDEDDGSGLGNVQDEALDDGDESD